MHISLSRRGIVRIISFSLAILFLLGGLVFTQYNRANKTELLLKNHYVNSINNLSIYLENIETALTKSIYAGTAPTMNAMTSKLWRESGFAKDCLSSLPLNEVQLEKTYKFLSQLGDYSVSLSKNMAKNGTITQEERENLMDFKEYTTLFLESILVLQDALQTGSVSLNEASSSALQAQPVSGSISEGFTEFESGFSDYPTLIYDGPFSDHLLQRTPEMTKSAPEISETDARNLAAIACGVPPESLETDTAEQGHMPSYCFKTQSVRIAITKQGGFISYLIANKPAENRNLSVEECGDKALEFFDNIGIQNLKQTYYEISDNQITINYAHTEKEVICYTDLVKVTVSMDDGSVTRYDARGYITNHKPRNDLAAEITQAEAQQSLSPILTVNRVQLVLVPSDGLSEVLCYEFLCSAQDDSTVLVYVNAKTGEEQQILVVYSDENGTLTL